METKKLCVTSFAAACSVVWGAAVFMAGALNLYRPGYGKAFLNLLASIYPLYSGVATLKSVGILTACGFFDGAMGGLIFALLYNLLASGKK